MKRWIRSVVVGTCLCGAAAPAATAQEWPTILQYFEADWTIQRARMADVFIAGYDAAWLPPPNKGAEGTSSIGYNTFDRFDLGTTTAPTRYGTLSDFRLLTREYHAAGARVFIDWIMNHNASLDNSTPGFIQQGGYPGFVLTLPGDTWGDFHPPGTQSENPGGANYNLFEGRLVGLIDIAQEKNHSFIRHPVDAGNPDNLPAGTLYNLPNSANRRFYPDRDLPAQNVTNPGTPRNPGTTNFTFYPYNLDDPTQGDPVVENATGLLMRATQYHLEVLGVDGFRLDAAKHIPTWFWDTYWDACVFQRYVAFDGTVQTPFSFVEAVDGPDVDPIDWTRKDGFGNRDALDLNEAGALRDLVDFPGSNSWQNPLNASIDNQDGGLNNGSLGVHHVSSHDNANSGANLDTFAFAYALMRTGPCVVYHNALQWGTNPQNFPRRNGRDDALGLGSDAIVTLVRLRNQFVRGRLDVLNFSDPVNQSLNDILILQLSKDVGGGNLVGNVILGVSDLQTNGQNATDQRWVQTAFAPGTRLHEQTGNAANPTVDLPGISTDDVAEVLTTDADRRILIRVPRNRNASGTNHGRGYVAYAPAVPSGTLSFSNVAYTIPADPPGTPAHARRLNPVHVITDDSFQVRLDTTQTDPLDPNTDDRAVFRVDQGFVDHNGNGVVDYLVASEPDYGGENFLTQNQPLYFNPGAGTGVYRQTLSAAALGEGYHYVNVMAFRHRADGGSPIYADFRKVIYVDRLPPQVQLVAPTQTCAADITQLPVTLTVRADDLTVDRVHIFFDLPAGTDFQFLADLGIGAATRSYDEFSLAVSTMTEGNHRVDVLAYESLTSRVTHQTFTGIGSTVGAGAGLGDVNANGTRDGEDIRVFLPLVFGANPSFNPAADFNCDGLMTAADVPGFVAALIGG